MENTADTINKISEKRSGRLPARRLLVAALALQVAGLGFSIMLTAIHYGVHTNPDYQSVCAINDKINCQTVAQSPFSVFLGLPVSVLGIYGYLAMTLLAAWGLSIRRLHAGWPFGALFSLYTASLIASGLLGYVSFVRIDALCIFCAALYVVNTALFAVGVTMLKASGRGPVKALMEDLGALLSHCFAFAALVAVLGGMLALAVLLVPPYWQHTGWSQLPRLPTGRDDNGCHWIGAEKPLVTIVEFSDYQCPYCRRAHKEMREKAAKYPNEVRLIHHHLPLDSACNRSVKGKFHDRACEFSKAAECASEQGLFWEMNDALFAVQDTVPAENVDLEGLGIRIGLNRSAFKNCMAEEGIQECIEKDIAKAGRRQVAGTPTFFIGREAYPGQVPEAALEAALKSAREK